MTQTKLEVGQKVLVWAEVVSAPSGDFVEVNITRGDQPSQMVRVDSLPTGSAGDSSEPQGAITVTPAGPNGPFDAKFTNALHQVGRSISGDPIYSSDSPSGGSSGMATSSNDIAVAVGLAIYARMVRLSHDSNQTVSEKRDYYVTLRQLEEAFVQMRDEVRR